MKVKVLCSSRYVSLGKFPTYKKGTPVNITGNEDEDFPHWYPCTFDGHNTFVPDTYFADGKLTKDYNPTELPQQPGDVLEVLEIVNAWLFVENEQGVRGWFPTECVVSI